MEKLISKRCKREARKIFEHAWKICLFKKDREGFRRLVKHISTKHHRLYKVWMNNREAKLYYLGDIDYSLRVEENRWYVFHSYRQENES